MNFLIYKRILLLSIIISLAILYYEQREINAKERDKNVLIIAGITNSPPLEFLSDSKVPRGVYVELWELGGLKTGKKVN